MTSENMPAYPLAEVLDVKHHRVEVAEMVVKEKQKLLEAEQQKLKEREAERDKVKIHLKAKVDQLRSLFDEGTTSDKIDRSKIYIKVVREKLKSLAAGKMGYSTTQVGDLVAESV